MSMAPSHRSRLGWSLLLALWALPTALQAQSTFYDPGQIQRIELQFSQPNWDYRMDTAMAGAETFLLADWVKINGILYDSVGVKYKGNSSYDSTRIKNPLNISLDEFENQDHEGFTTIKLGNGYQDPSMIREVLAYDVLGNYMEAPRANFAQVYINGSYIGLYSNAENIDKTFCAANFYSSTGTFIKCNPIVTPGPTTKSNLKTITGVDSTGYMQRYELKSDIGWNELVDLCDVVTTNAPTLPADMDMDRVIWMLAFNDVLVNLDSYSGALCQNYYLYKDFTGHFNPVVWDLNMAFGGFPFLGSGPSSTATLTVADMEQMPIDIHATDPYWPLINAVMASPRYARMYLAHVRTIASEMIASGAYATTAATFQALVDTAVASDANKFFSYAQFQTGMTASTVVGSYSVPGIASLMNARWTYLQGTPQFALAQPVIASVLPSTTTPVLNAVVTITAQVSGADSVFLGYRLDRAQKFQRIVMYDDGSHGDGGAADGLYGADLTMSGAVAQYYVYAENADAGVFSPARAEHEYHELAAIVSLPAPGDVVINEFLAVNQTGQTDENGQYEDWIELYNTTNGTLSLTGLYLTDDVLNATRYAFPSGTVIPAHSVRIIWADADSSTGSYLHCNFKLSSGGETLWLSDGSTLMLDSITFGPQVADVSLGRCPDGTGAFAAQATPTFNALNCGVGMADASQAIPTLHTFPNPSHDHVQVTCDQPVKGDLQVWDRIGVMIYQAPWHGSADLNVGAWSSGIYFLRLGSATQKIVVTH